MTGRVQHVFFDLTDTLLRIHGSVGEIYSRSAARFGLDAPAPAIDRSFARAIAALPQPVAPGLAHVEIRRRERDWWRDVARRALAPWGDFPRFDEFFAEVFELFRTRATWELAPGVPAVLEAVRAQGRGVGILSDMDSRLFDVLADFGIAQLFDPVCLSFWIGYRKPDPRFFQAAAVRAGVRPPAAAHVGDNIAADVRGALAARMIAVHLDARGRGGTPAAAHAIRSLSELPALLERLDVAGSRDGSRRCAGSTLRARRRRPSAAPPAAGPGRPPAPPARPIGP